MIQGDQKIGDWTIAEFIRFLQQQMKDYPPTQIPNLVNDVITISTLITILDQIQLNQVQTTVGSAGSASALPANPSGYFKIRDYTGTTFVVPYYKAS